MSDGALVARCATGDSRHATLSAWLPNDATYLPLCTANNGTPELEVSALVSLSALPH